MLGAARHVVCLLHEGHNMGSSSDMLVYFGMLPAVNTMKGCLLGTCTFDIAHLI